MKEEETRRTSQQEDALMQIEGSMEEDPQSAMFNKILMLYLPWTLAGIFFTLYVLGLGTAGAEERNRESYENLHALLTEDAAAEKNIDDRLASLNELMSSFKDESGEAQAAQNTALNLLLSDKDLSYLPRDNNRLATTVLLWADYQRNTLQPRERALKAREDRMDELEGEFSEQVIRLARDLYFGAGQDSAKRAPVISSDDAQRLIPLALRETFGESNFKTYYDALLSSFSAAHAESLEKLLSYSLIREILTENGVTITGNQQKFSITFWPANLGA